MLDHKKFTALAQVRGDHLVSFFIPTYRAGHEQEDRIRYKNALSQVREKLEAEDWSAKDINKYLKEATSRIDDLDFWQHQSDGLAVFIYDGKTEFHPLPIDFDSFVFVGDRLYLKPLLPVITGNAKFFLLAISQDDVRFFEADRYSIAEIEADDELPSDIGDLMKYIDGEKTLQHHSGQGGNETAVFHGQGAGKQMEDQRIREYVRMINKGIMDLMCDDDTEPLILATVEETAALYRQENEYENLMEAYVAGNPDEDDPALLHEKAWELMLPTVKADIDSDAEAFDAAIARDEASFSLHDIVPAAIAGRVDTLFVAMEDEIWGTYETDTHSVTVHEEPREESIPLLNEAAVTTYLNGGTVYVLERSELPRPTASLNAIYRYSVEPA